MPNSPHPDPWLSLSAEQCERLHDLFDQVLDVAEGDRAAWMQAHVPDPAERAALSRLLDADAGEGPLDLPSTERVRQLDEQSASMWNGLVGQRMGAFRLTRLIGQGGMAVVFLGERDIGDFDQRVAVKLLRRGLYSAMEQRLFRRERQALASLAHPNIAHLIDGGISEAGVPYLVLEYVDGQPITTFAASRRLSIGDRLRLFVVVCRAVAAAHRQLIVHRDLKPSNILVTDDGSVKLLDFGIAKLLADDAEATRTDIAPMTPEYAAPEQRSGDTVTTATDVYALGVLLHELLLGERPRETDTGQRPSQRAVASGDAVSTAPEWRPSAIRGDLDNILLKALAAEPVRRYGSATELGDDVQRHLAGEPVLAHPPSRWYRTRKFVRRHRGGVALTMAFTLGLLVSLAAAIWQAGIARQEAARARAEALRANTTRDFLEDLFKPVREQLAEGRMPSLRELVEVGALQIDDHADLEPAQRIDLLLMFSRLQSMLAEPVRSRELAERAHELATTTQPEASADRIAVMLALGYARLGTGDLDGAAPLLHEVERWQVAHGVTGTDRIELLANLSRLENEAQRPDRALPYAEQELAERVALYGADHARAATGYNNLGYVLEALGRFDEAVDAYEKALAIDDRSLDPGSLQRAYPLGNLAQALFNGGRLIEARVRFTEALALYDEVALDKPPRTLLGQLTMLAETQLALGDLAGMQATVTELDRRVAQTAPTSVDRAIVTRLRARLALEHGDLEGALTRLDALATLLEPVPDYIRRRSEGVRDLLRAEIVLLGHGERDAEKLARGGTDAIGAVFYPHYLVPYGKAMHALACASQPTSGCAESAFTDAAELLGAPSHSGHPSLLSAQVALARVELIRDRDRQAVDRLLAAIDAARNRGVPDTAPRLRQARAWLALALAGTGECAAAASERRLAEQPDGVAMPHPFVTHALVTFATTGCGAAR